MLHWPWRWPSSSALIVVRRTQTHEKDLDCLFLTFLRISDRTMGYRCLIQLTSILVNDVAQTGPDVHLLLIGSQTFT
jgi:hypothetical protein